MHASDEQPLTLTTEDLPGALRRVFLLLKINTFSILVGVYFCFGPRPADLDDVKFLIFWDLYAVLVSVAVLLASRGTWVIDSEGITYEPLFGRPRSLAWNSVTRVLWDENRDIRSMLKANPHTFLEGDGVCIRLAWTHWPGPIAERARRRIEAFLGEDFDLAPLPPPEEGCHRFEAWMRKAAVSVAFSRVRNAIFWIVAIYLGFFHAGPRSHALLRDWVNLTFLVSVLMLGHVLGGDRRRRLRADPEWPWRGRRSLREATADS